jgi:hypothetical protein
MKNKKQLRKDFNYSVFERDGHKCVFCDITEKLDAHHITDRHRMPCGGYVPENGITLCPEHHLLAEKYHMTDGSEFIEGMHPDDLYHKIGSRFRMALIKSKELY